jgi:archaellum biogenesis ATPase FlaH
MDSRGHVVFITAGEKDVMSLYAHGYDAICLNSETASMPEGLLDLLELLYEHVIVLYDSDPTGIKSSISLCKQNNLKRLELPSEFTKRKLGKDISDYFKVLNDPELLSANKDIVGLELFDNSIQDVIDGKVNFIDVVVVEKEILSPTVRTATQRLIDAQNIPPIKSLMGPFWHSNELAILFGDTGLGKSILAVNIADVLSKGLDFMSLENQNDPLVTLYFDFELSDKQFQKRYTNASGELYEFHPNFFIDNINFVELAQQNMELSFDEMLYNKIASSVKKIGAEVLIIDNITFLKSESSQDANVAMQIMTQLNKLKKDLGLSILVLAHTPKISGNNCITISDLAGSKHLSNFSDSVFAIGKSAKDKNLRYLKQVKPSRSAECVYDTNNVLICELDKEDKGLLFEFVGLSREQEHLSSDSKPSEELLEEALELRKTGMVIRDIAKALGTSKSTIGRLLAK